MDLNKLPYNDSFHNVAKKLNISSFLCILYLQLTCMFPDCTRRVPISRALYFCFRVAAQTSGVDLLQ